MTNTQETQEKPETKQNTLVVGPFLGELGWECFLGSLILEDCFYKATLIGVWCMEGLVEVLCMILPSTGKLIYQKVIPNVI